MPPWFATFGKPHYTNFGFAQDDRLSYRFVATLTLASPVRTGGGKPRRDRRWRLAEVAFSQENDGGIVFFCFVRILVYIWQAIGYP